MSKSPRKTPRKAVAERVGADQPPQADFDEVLSLIEAARTRAVAAVNTALIDLYWQHRRVHQPQDRSRRLG